MKKTAAYPGVAVVQPMPGKQLRVTFQNGDVRVYDCAPLLHEPDFSDLRDEAVFRNVQPDPHGYGIFWNDRTDLAESELWLNGTSQNEPH